MKTDQFQPIYVNEMHFRPDLALVQVDDSRMNQVLGAVQGSDHSSSRFNGLRSRLSLIPTRRLRHVAYPREHAFIMITDSSVTDVLIKPLISMCIFD